MFCSVPIKMRSNEKMRIGQLACVRYPNHSLSLPGITHSSFYQSQRRWMFESCQKLQHCVEKSLLFSHLSMYVNITYMNGFPRNWQFCLPCCLSHMNKDKVSFGRFCSLFTFANSKIMASVGTSPPPIEWNKEWRCSGHQIANVLLRLVWYGRKNAGDKQNWVR